MTTAYSTNLGLALPVEGELAGTWGDTVNNGITDYLDIAVAGTLTLNGDGAVTLTDTNGDSSSTNIGSTTAQYAVLNITGTLTTTKVITAPSHSKVYTVINAATGGSVTVKASGQTGVTVAVGEKAYIAFNGTDYVQIAGSATDGVSTISFGSTGLTPSTATSGAVTVAGTLTVANGGTGATTLTANNVLLGNGTSALQVVAPGSSGNILTSTGTTWESSTPAAQSYPGAGIANSTGSAWTTSYTTTGSGTVVALATSPSFTTPVLGTPSSGTLSNCTVDGTNPVGFKNIPQTGSDKTAPYTLATTDVGKFVGVGASGSVTIPDATFATGDVISIFNNTSSGVTITCSITTAYIGGTDSDKASVTLATRGVATVLFISGTVCVITGNVS